MKKNFFTVVLLMFSLLIVTPMLFTISKSFINVEGDGLSFNQYSLLISCESEYLIKYMNSIAYVVPIVVLQLLVSTLASFAFSRSEGRIKQIIFFVYVIIMLMPYQVNLVPNYLVSDYLDLINTRWAIWLPGIFSPFAVYIITNYMKRIPKGLFEAAKIDGAGEFKIFTRISLPVCKGIIAASGMLIFFDYWNMVEQPLVLLSSDNLYPLSVCMSNIEFNDLDVAFAVATIYMIPGIIIFLGGEKYLIEGITYQGGIKG